MTSLQIDSLANVVNTLTAVGRVTKFGANKLEENKNTDS